MPETDTATVIQPNAADRQPRTENGQAVVTDPEAPHGWMVDPKTGQRRPKKRPGRQARSVEAPRDRPTNKPRTAKEKPAKKAEAEYVKPVADLTEAVWMILAATPKLESKTKVLGINLSETTIRLRAQAAIVKDEAQSIVAGVSKMAAHSDIVAKGVDKLSEESGPAWILPAMFALLPFVAQTAAMWKAPVAGDVAKMAERSEQEWKEFLDSMMHREPEPPAEQPQPRADIVLRAETDGNAPS